MHGESVTLDAILNLQKLSMMSAGHHSDSESTVFAVSKSVKTCFFLGGGGYFCKVQLLATEILGYACLFNDNVYNFMLNAVVQNKKAVGLIWLLDKVIIGLYYMLQTTC